MYLETQLKDLGNQTTAAPADGRGSPNGGYASTAGYGQRADAGS
jgi:hypothetical protein